MYRFGIYYNKSSLSSGNIEVEGGHLSLVAMKGAYIGVLIGAGMGSMTKFFRYRHHLSMILLWYSSGVNVLELTLRSTCQACIICSGGGLCSGWWSWRGVGIAGYWPTFLFSS
jgi:hypothetical protein